MQNFIIILNIYKYFLKNKKTKFKLKLKFLKIIIIIKLIFLNQIAENMNKI